MCGPKSRRLLAAACTHRRPVTNGKEDDSQTRTSVGHPPPRVLDSCTFRLLPFEPFDPAPKLDGITSVFAAKYISEAASPPLSPNPSLFTPRANRQAVMYHFSILGDTPCFARKPRDCRLQTEIATSDWTGKPRNAVGCLIRYA